MPVALNASGLIFDCGVKLLSAWEYEAFSSSISPFRLFAIFNLSLWNKSLEESFSFLEGA